MKVLFVIAAPRKVGEITSLSPHHPHLGVGYLTAMLKKNGHSVKIVDMRLRYKYEDLFNFVNEYNPDFIGVATFSSFGYLNTYKIIEYLKDKFPKKPIILGGPIVVNLGKKVLEGSKTDFALRGEGEYAILEFCDTLKNDNDDFSKIPGLIWRKNGKIIENQKRVFIADLDAIPFPDFENFELDKYIGWEQKELPIVSSRGCPFSCAFCDAQLSMGRFRARSAENVVDEIEYWYKRGFRRFAFMDDNFSWAIERAIKICDIIMERGLKIEYRLTNGMRADRINYELAKKLKDSGCSFIAFGVETGNEEIMKVIKKGIKHETVREAVDLANKVGLTHRITFVIGHPHETYKKAMDSIKFAESLPSNTIPSFYSAMPYPGTELFDWVKKNGKFIYPPEVYLNSIDREEREPVFETKEFPYNERKKVLRKGILLFRKRGLRIVFGKFFGSIFYFFALSDKLWDIFYTIFQGTKGGYRIFKLFAKRANRANREQKYVNS